MSATILLILRLALTTVLYAFLGWALWVLWQDLRRRSADLASQQTPPLILRMAQEDGEQVFRFTGGIERRSEVFIGRDPACECRIEDKSISARHAVLSYHHGQWWVEDLGSKNGTFLNDVTVSGAVVLTTGDQLRCGACSFSVAIGEELQ